MTILGRKSERTQTQPLGSGAWRKLGTRVRVRAGWLWLVACGAAVFAAGLTNSFVHAAALEPGTHHRLRLDAFYEAYFARQETLYGEKQYQMWSAQYSGQADANWIGARLDVGGLAATNVSAYSSLYAPEGYVQFRQSSISFLPQEVSIGRMKDSWSRLDERWNLGLVQPMFRMDYVRPEQQGLTGVFLTWKGNGARFTLFGSGLYIPEQGPPFLVRDGEIRSGSPWFTEPTNELILFAQPTEIQYRIRTPDVADVVFRGSIGALFVLGDPEAGGPWSTGGYLSKPRNSLMLPFTAPLVLGPTTQVAEVTVFPRVERHHLAVFDIGYRAGDEGMFVSVLAEFPNNPRVDADITRQRLAPQILVSPGMEARFFPSAGWGPRARLSYLHQDGGETTEEGPFATDRGTIFGYRLSFTSAISLEMASTLFRTTTGSLDVNVRWIEELRQHGTLLMSEVHYRFGRAWELVVIADVLGSRAPENEQSGLINRYRGNDRVVGGIGYVF